MEADSQPSSTDSNVDATNVPGKMFVGGLSWQTTGEGLREYFNKYGEIKECLVMKDPTTKRSRGFGFITFADPSSVEDVIKETHILDEKKIDPKVAVPRRPQPKMVTKTKKVFIGGLSSNTTEADMKKHFEEFGTVTETQLLFDKITHRHRGFGFVTYESEDNADEACEEPFHIINEKKVEVKKAQPKEVMLSLQGGRARGRGYAARGYLYPFPHGLGRGAFPFGGFGYSPMPGYNAAAAAAAAALFAGRAGRGGGGRRGYMSGGYPGMLSFPGAYHSHYLGPGPDQRRTSGGHQYYADYAAAGNQGGGRGGGNRTDVAPVNQAVSDYADHYAAAAGVTMNNYAQQGFGPPPSPVNRFSAARSPGPLAGVGQDLPTYMSSGASGADSLNYTATSPQSTGFGHTMILARR